MKKIPCKVCKKLKPFNRKNFYFSSSWNTKNGSNSVCKPCHIKKVTAWVRKNIEHVRKYRLDYYEKYVKPKKETANVALVG